MPIELTQNWPSRDKIQLFVNFEGKNTNKILKITIFAAAFNMFCDMKRIIFCLMALMGVMTVSAQQKVENKDAQAAINNIMTRTSIRQYTNEPVSKADIETMLRAGMAAPTAVNKQPWHFVAVTNKEKLAELAGRRGMIKQAGVAIVVCGNLDKAMQGKAQEYWIQDCSAATENILLAANALGLGAVWTGCYPMEDRVAEVSKALKLPETIVPLCVIAIGHPAEQPTPKDKWKPENVSYNEFGGQAE